LKQKFTVGDTVRFNKKAERLYGGRVSNREFVVYEVYPPNDTYSTYRIRVNEVKPKGTGITQTQDIFSKIRCQ